MSKITPRQFALHQLRIAKGFVGTTRKNNKPQVTRFLNLFGLPFADSKGKPYAFCASGIGWCGAKTYCDLHDIQYTAENAVAVFRSVLDEVAKLFYKPSPRCSVMIADAKKRGTWRTKEQAGEMLPGDIAFFQMDDDPEADHVEFVEFPPEDKTPEENDPFGTVGFNTTLKIGSQTNGGAVAQKVRTVGELYGWIALR